MAITKRDVAFISINILVLLIASLMVIRYFAPGLLGLSQDLILVQEDTEVAPFYENVFAYNESDDYLISDPHTVVRATPLVRRYDNAGPNDLLGFRNLAVPNSADIVFIGDSQTYGNNAAIEHTTPSLVESTLRSASNHRVYSMATGGWGALQYYYIAQKALAFNPKVLVVSFYTGNDPLESFALAYGDERWQEFRPDTALAADDMPSTPEENAWGAVFENGNRTAFTPQRRYISVNDHPVANAGWRIMEQAATAISELGKANGVHVIFTVIPTKEFVYQRKLEAEAFEMPTHHQQLIAAERHRIEEFEKFLVSVDGANYVPVWSLLQEAALGDEELYPQNSDGHPLAGGYLVVANALLPALQELLGAR